MCKDLNRMTATLDELQRTIRGSNGTPGIVTQLGELTMKVNRLECNDTIDQLDQAIRGTNDAPGIAAQMSKLAAKVDKIDVLERVLDGDEKNSGLIERVRKLEDIQKELRYWFYLASGAVLLWVINGILDWLPKLSTLLSQ